MSFLCLGKRLQPARKAWKNFTNKLQSKLHKLQRSKAIKKPRNRINATPSLTLQLQTKRRLIKPSHALGPRHHHRCYLLQKRPAPVFIDDLFKQQPVSDGVECFQPPLAASASKGKIEKCSPSVKIKLIEQPSALPGTSKATLAKRPPTRFKKIHHQPSATALPKKSKEDEKGKEKTGMADDMWESLGLASPQMHGIDERAEEFIARFRAEMELQEKMARGLHNNNTF